MNPNKTGIALQSALTRKDGVYRVPGWRCKDGRCARTEQLAAWGCGSDNDFVRSHISYMRDTPLTHSPPHKTPNCSPAGTLQSVSCSHDFLEKLCSVKSFCLFIRTNSLDKVHLACWTHYNLKVSLVRPGGTWIASVFPLDCNPQEEESMP